MTDPTLYIPSMWDDLGILLYDPQFWVLSSAVVIGVALVTRWNGKRNRRKEGGWY